MLTVAARFQFAMFLIFVGLVVPAVAAESESKFTEQQLEHFEKKIRPLLVKRCYQCHSRDAKRLEGGLYLDSRKGALKGGDTGPAIKPSDLKASLLIDAIRYTGDYKMPPKGKLPDSEIKLLEDWVRAGAPWSPTTANSSIKEFSIAKRKAAHWAWQPVNSARAPQLNLEKLPTKIARRLRVWNESPIDQHIASKVLGADLIPNEPAARHTLIRRVYFDVIGLPPTAAEVDEFVNDSSPKAFDKVVDRLLDSPHFGERWGRHWLDLVRYAETLGHEFDYPLHHAHQYRDYVIRAFNADVPYDQFVREHIAGDLLTNPRRHPTEQYNESVIGTGFWFLGEDKHSPVDVRLEEALRFDNQLDVFSKTFLGLTVACAKCHDHKFDAISTKDYYALVGFLQSSRRDVALLDPGRKIESKVKELKRVLKEAQQAVDKTIRSSESNRGEHIAKYLAAASEVLFGKRKPTDDAGMPKKRPDVVFADFENGTYDGWKTAGNAFGNAPATGTARRQQKVSGFDGKRLVNTFQNTDGATGTMMSDPFTISHDGIRFLIGGGAHKKQTCVNLKVNNKVVRTATGKNNERLEPHAWDVSDLVGKQAVIEIVDNHRGGWGHINLDHIVFTDESTLRFPRPVEIVAKELNVDPSKLMPLVKELSSAEVTKPTHPMHAWSRLARSTAQEFAATKKAVAGDLTRLTNAAAESRKKSILFGDFNDGRFDDWFVTGHAFSAPPTEELRWNSAGPHGGVIDAGVTHSGLIANQLAGVIRSRTFKIEKPNLLYRVAGRNAQIRLIIDGYVMDVFNGLLFRGAAFKVDHDDFRWHRQAADVANYVGNTAHIEIIDDGNGWVAIDEIRFADSGPNPTDAPNGVMVDGVSSPDVSDIASYNKQLAETLALAVKAWQEKNASNDQGRLVSWLFKAGLIGATRDAEFTRLTQEAENLRKQIPAPMRTIAMTDGSPENEHVFIRGSHKNLGPVVERRFLEAVAGSNQEQIEDSSGRLQLVDRMLDPSNPFVSRVIANRIWHHLFGRGIVASVDNFGVLGERPTHPELLDHLADKFVRDGWSIKKLIRDVVLTETYQMSSRPNPNAAEIDPANHLLHRQRIRRLQGEVIRDAMLSISGRLNRSHFGPSIPVHLTEFMQGRGRPRRNGPLDGAGRRSVYISVNRNFLSPMMLAFDTPAPFSSMGRRTVSNVPAQALIMLNDPLVIQQAELWAKRVLAQPRHTNEQRITAIYKSAFGRKPTESEVNSAIAFLDSQGERHNVPKEQRQKHLQSWADFCHVMFNVKEFIFIN